MALRDKAVRAGLNFYNASPTPASSLLGQYQKKKEKPLDTICRHSLAPNIVQTKFLHFCVTGGLETVVLHDKLHCYFTIVISMEGRYVRFRGKKMYKRLIAVY